MQLSLVIPVHNEAGNIHPLLAEIDTALQALDAYEILYVDDGSSDATAQELRTALATYPRLRVLRHRKSCGQSTAVLSGVRAASGAWIATLDGDGQNDPSDLPRMILRAAEADHPALVNGWRRQRQDSGFKRISSRIANAVRGGLLGDHTPDTGCGIKLFQRAVFLQLPYFDHCHRFLPALFLRQGCTVVSLEVQHRPSTLGKSKYGLHNRLWVGLVDIIGVMWLQRRCRLPEVKEIKPVSAATLNP